MAHIGDKKTFSDHYFCATFSYTTRSYRSRTVKIRCLGCVNSESLFISFD
ncbi:hypothetical protein HanIR_Chr16g0788821 [Helianthus annuus]|nr:hypothetical protein HanIR_Chr16g0788821 [Helianthus annuus]